MKSVPMHAKDRDRGTLKVSDFYPSNLHPKAKFRIIMALFGSFLIAFGCIYMLSMTTITFNPDLSTSAGLSAMFRNCVAGGYILGSILVIIILWHLMIKDCPLTPAAKANYVASHDKSMKGVKVIASMATAITSKGSGSSINSFAEALEDYLETDEEVVEKNKQMINPKVR